MKDLMRRDSKRSEGLFLITVACLIAVMLLGSAVKAMAGQTRIVVLPFYVEEGADAGEGGKATLHYRRMLKFINNQLVRNDFEVVNPFAADSSEREYNRIMQRTREDSPLAAQEMCKKYGTDAAYIVWLNVKYDQTPDGYCQARARVDGEGFDSAARDLGAGLSKSFNVSRRDCDDAIAEVEKEIGDEVGRKLTAWDGERAGRTVVSTGNVAGARESSAAEGGILARNINAKENTLNLRLDGANEYELAEVFGKVVNTVSGVVEAKRYRSQIVSDNPQGSYILWRVQVEDTDPFRLEANIVKRIKDVLAADGDVTIDGIPYRYTQNELLLLKGFRPGNSTTREVQFVIDRERVRDREMLGGRRANGFE
jgi:hypothetical protein